ncbi:MAG: zf-HC2 domain-containing protein [Kofleriaceae bacterium]
MTTHATSMCASIEPTAMAYLDDELASQERRELELHLLECERCRGHVDRERDLLTRLRQRLGQGIREVPAPSELLMARLGRGLDEIDAELATAEADAPAPPTPITTARGWRRGVLPGAAALAAAAALVVFAAAPPTVPTAAGGETVAHEAIRQQLRGAPLEVQGASTGPWLARHFQPDVTLPRFPEGRARLVGARLTSLAGQAAAQLVYEVGAPRQRLIAFVIDGVRPDALTGGRRLTVGGRSLYLVDAYGAPAVAYVDGTGRGYVFTSTDLAAGDLVDVVVASNLIGDAGGRVR